ncbi:hypothetical protein E2C01_095232 [Portunus trituberculatus]|uniref:Uncharacterized protein n=1 Tax=Portunus trituberculatus TaxID=210409 RepID=A0A5B7K582_PORTR|nr:hypothetical protein [Portunus trituberculatus]
MTDLWGKQEQNECRWWSTGKVESRVTRLARTDEGETLTDLSFEICLEYCNSSTTLRLMQYHSCEATQKL